jgi:uncharacterized protein YecE (DUF72 family)
MGNCTTMRGSFHIGCSGWSYRHWREPVYGGRPAATWLEQYAEMFSTVEVNATFYRLPRRSTVAAWAARTPADFRFAIKVSRYLTHVKRLTGIREGCERLLSRIDPLLESGRLEALLWQLPESFPRDDARLEAALERLPGGMRHCFEFRHSSWFEAPVLRLLQDAGAALVIGDDPSRPFQLHRLTTDLAYVRFHRGRRGRRGNYSQTELSEWCERLRAWSRRADVLAYFNNDWEAFAVHNALDLQRMLERDR